MTDDTRRTFLLLVGEATLIADEHDEAIQKTEDATKELSIELMKCMKLQVR